MTQGRRHLWERPTILVTIFGVFILPLLIAIVSFPFFAFAPPLYGFFLIAEFLVCMIYFTRSYLYRPKFPKQVREELVARPQKKASVWAGERGLGEERKPYISKIVPLKLDLLAYVHGKPNRNVLITGSSGQGKSKLSRHLLGLFAYQKVVFSFKPNDEYLKMGYPTADMTSMLPNPFTNTEAFISAFLVAFPLTTAGIQASLVPATLEKLARQCKNWKDFDKIVAKTYAGTKDNNLRSALAFVQANLPRLMHNTGEFAIAKDDVVLDFSSLNENARSFYAELVLRQLYADMETQKRKDMLICVDEAHRLTGGEYGNYHTILVEMSREIRDKGMLWAVTQNYSDIPDSIRNQFATQFIFKTTSQKDQTALRAIDNFLAWTASSLPNHYFIDAQYPSLHEFIPLYCYNPKGEETAETKEVARLGKAITQTSKLEILRPPEDRPTPTVHAALLALNAEKGASLVELAKWLKKSGFVTGDPTIYGYKGRKGVFENAVSLGLAKKAGKNYELTDSGRRWVEPSLILEKERNLGSDLHRQLLVKTINHLHSSNMLVLAGDGGFDLVAYPVDTRKKYLWNDARRRGYEIQTTGRKDSVSGNSKKRTKYNIPITWVSYDGDTLEEIKKLTNGKDEYLMLKV